MLVVLSLALVGFFLVCLRTLVKATFRCCSGVVNRKYLGQVKKILKIVYCKTRL